MRTIWCAVLLAAVAFAQPVPPAPPKPPKPPTPPKLFSYRESGEGKWDWDRHSDRAYDRGRRALDQRQWDEAVSYFDEAANNKERGDAALYWKSIALHNLGRGADANAALDTLSRSYAQSRWAVEGKKLRAEMAQTPARKQTAEQSAEEEELKIMAASGLMESSPDRAVPLVEKMLERRLSPRLQQRALDLLTNSRQPRAREIVARIAKGDAIPDLQVRALRRLGSERSAENLQLLEGAYRSATDPAVKSAVLQAYVASGDRERLLAVAKTDPDLEMRYRAIQYLGGTRSSETADALAAMYKQSADPDIRRRLLHSLQAQGAARQIVEVARAEKDPELRKRAIQTLSHMKSQEATDYLMELLK